MEDIKRILFAAPKQGGILQSSGLLDLKSLIALSETCKASAFDELSLNLWIGNEMTRHHKIQTKEEIIEFCTQLWRGRPLLKQWLERDCTSGDASGIVTRIMLSNAVPYEVMLAKMLRAVPQSERLQIVSEQDHYGLTLLHSAAMEGKLESVKTILALYPKSQHPQVVNTRDTDGRTVLHWDACSGNHETTEYIFTTCLSESQRVQAVIIQDKNGDTTLHYAAFSDNFEMIQFLLHSISESERLRAVSMGNQYGHTVLHLLCAKSDDKNSLESLMTLLRLLPESQRSQAINSQTQGGLTALSFTSGAIRESILELLPKVGSSELHAKRLHSSLQSDNGDNVEQRETKRQRSDEAD